MGKNKRRINILRPKISKQWESLGLGRSAHCYCCLPSLSRSAARYIRISKIDFFYSPENMFLCEVVSSGLEEFCSCVSRFVWDAMLPIISGHSGRWCTMVWSLVYSGSDLHVAVWQIELHWRTKSSPFHILYRSLGLHVLFSICTYSQILCFSSRSFSFPLLVRLIDLLAVRSYWPSCFGFTMPRASAVLLSSLHSGRGISTPSVTRP